jgi:squalene-hopene/tetraprenyl-beta-curcumene cyclase
MKLASTLMFLSCFTAILGAEDAVPQKTWNATAAAAYLDGRISWWMDWPSAARDHDTFCVSCHTAVPYAVGRPSLRGALGETNPSALESRLVANVTKRVRLWKEVAPFYATKKEGDPKTIESRGTEAVLNALILARYSQVSGQASGKLSPDAKTAFENLWSEQLKEGDARGAWNWLQFHNSPWEGDSQFFGAALAAVAVSMAPAEYRKSPEIQDGLKSLAEYVAREQASQIPINRVTLLWASAKVPGLLTREQQKSIVADTLAAQQEDGGFCLCSLVGGWKRRDNTPLEARGDGYATGLVLLALREVGVPADHPQVKRAMAWLAANQQPEGNWLAWSLNKKRDPASDAGHFMGDAATAFAAMALAQGK